MNDKQIKDYFYTLLNLMSNPEEKDTVFRYFVLANLWSSDQESDFYNIIFCFTHPAKSKAVNLIKEKYNVNLDMNLQNFTHKKYIDILEKINNGKKLATYPNDDIYKELIKEDLFGSFFTQLLSTYNKII
jgi:hypothetical protein